MVGNRFDKRSWVELPNGDANVMSPMVSVTDLGFTISFSIDIQGFWLYYAPL